MLCDLFIFNSEKFVAVRGVTRTVDQIQCDLILQCYRTALGKPCQCERTESTCYYLQQLHDYMVHSSYIYHQPTNGTSLLKLICAVSFCKYLQNNTSDILITSYLRTFLSKLVILFLFGMTAFTMLLKDYSKQTLHYVLHVRSYCYSSRPDVFFYKTCLLQEVMYAHSSNEGDNYH